jgi:hypothetical protein
MHGDENYEGFDELLRSIAEEVGRSVERAAERVDVEEIAGTIGVDPDRAKEWVDSAASWLRGQAEKLGEEATSGSREAPREPDDPLRGAAAHPLDLPTEEQGLALAALDSGRWTVEPGSETLSSHGEGSAPADALGLVRELRVRDWIESGGELTLAGRHALSRWLDAATRL